jgi:hypothetical protein
MSRALLRYFSEMIKHLGDYGGFKLDYKWGDINFRNNVRYSCLLALSLNILELKNSEAIVKRSNDILNQVYSYAVFWKIRLNSSLIHYLKLNIKKL